MSKLTFKNPVDALEFLKHQHFIEDGDSRIFFGRDYVYFRAFLEIIIHKDKSAINMETESGYHKFKIEEVKKNKWEITCNRMSIDEYVSYDHLSDQDE